MFDTVICDRAMPDGLDGDGVRFQTKDFECTCMDVYTITAGGRLVADIWHCEDVPKEDRPFRDAPNDSLLSIAGSVRRVVDGKKDLNYHGKFNFYTMRGGVFHEYAVKFTDGLLVSIETSERRKETP